MPKDWVAEIAAKIPLNSLPDAYHALAEIIGVENTLKLADHLGGTAFYFRKIDSLLSYVRDEKIREEFNGANHKELARKYDLSEIWIRQIVEHKTHNEQTDLFKETGT